MHGGRLHSTDQRSTFVSSLNVRDSKPPPIPPSMLGGNVGLTISTSYPAATVHFHGGRMSPVTSHLPPGPESRKILIGDTTFPAQKPMLLSSAVRSNPVSSRQISVQYQTVQHQLTSSDNSNYSSPRSSIASEGDSKNSSPRASLTNTALYEQKFGSPRSSVTLVSPRPGWNAVAFDSGNMPGLQDQMSFHRSLEQDSGMARPQQQMSQAMIKLGQRNTALLSDGRYIEPAPPHIYTDPRQRTLPPQSAVSVHTSVYPGNTSEQMTNQAPNGESHHLLSSPNTSFSTAVANSVHLATDSQNTPPSIPARVPLNPTNKMRDSSLDAEKAVTALTHLLEKEMKISGSLSRRSPNLPADSQSIAGVEPPPPYHGPHDVQTSVKVESQPQKANVRLVAPVQGIRVQTGPVASSTLSAMSPGMKSRLAFQMTPPKHQGPSDAERKLAALTQQLEDEMDQVTSAEYFGRKTFFFLFHFVHVFFFLNV